MREKERLIKNKVNETQIDVAQLVRLPNGGHEVIWVQPLHSTMAFSELRNIYGVIER